VSTLVSVETHRAATLVRKRIPERSTQQAHRGRNGGRPPSFDATDYTQRNTVERAINTLKQFRTVATRYDKRVYIFAETIDVASIRIWLRDSVPWSTGQALVPIQAVAGCHTRWMQAGYLCFVEPSSVPNECFIRSFGRR
jgi:hypothetical protein